MLKTLKSFFERGNIQRYEKFLKEYKLFTDQQLWDWYCGLDMEYICNGHDKYDADKFRLVGLELESRNNPKYPVR